MHENTVDNRSELVDSTSLLGTENKGVWKTFGLFDSHEAQTSDILTLLKIGFEKEQRKLIFVLRPIRYLGSIIYIWIR